LEPTDINRRMFDEAHQRHGQGRTALPAIVRQTLHGVSGKSVLHLHSGSGEASAELAALGAVVTATDPDEALVDAARERHPTILWIAADAQTLPANLRRGRFDLVYSPEGVLGRLVTSLVRAGFRVEALEEYPLDVSGRRHDRRIPGSFLLYATKS